MTAIPLVQRTMIAIAIQMDIGAMKSVLVAYLKRHEKTRFEHKHQRSESSAQVSPPSNSLTPFPFICEAAAKGVPSCKYFSLGLIIDS